MIVMSKAGYGADAAYSPVTEKLETCGLLNKRGVAPGAGSTILAAVPRAPVAAAAAPHGRAVPFPQQPATVTRALQQLDAHAEQSQNGTQSQDPRPRPQAS